MSRFGLPVLLSGRVAMRTVVVLALFGFAVACSDSESDPVGGDVPGSTGASGGAGGAPVGGGAGGAGGAGGTSASGATGASDGGVAGGGAAGSEPGGDAATPIDPNEVPPTYDFVDPGSAPWEPVPADQVEEVCKLDPALLAQANTTLNVPWAVVRYGRLCHEFYPPGQDPDLASEVWSTTKSLGAVVVGIANYQTRDIPESGRKTGQLSDWDRVDHWLDAFTYNAEAHVAHVLAMVAHNVDLSYGAKQHSYDTVGDVQINSLSAMVNAAIAQDPTRLGANIEEFTQRFLYGPLGMTHSTWSAGAVDKIFAYTWSSTVRDMLRVGLVLLNRGVWSGGRVLGEDWVYKTTHPAFEDGNTGYGYLTWLSSRSNHSIGFSPPTGQGPSIACAPIAVWNSYPHGELSLAPDCNYAPPETCEQEIDDGVWQAVGFMGMVIQGHPGLDMVLVVKNDALGGAGLWPAVLPAVVAKDPMYPGDQTAFCDAYSHNRYAPDFRPWQVVP